MERFNEIFAKHKTTIVLSLGGVILFVLATTLLFAIRHPDTSEEPIAEPAIETVESDQSNKAIPLNETQTKMKENYSNEIKEFDGILTSNKWVTSKESATLDISNDMMTLYTAGSTSAQHSYAIVSLHTKTSNTKNDKNEVINKTTYTADVLFENDVYNMLILTKNENQTTKGASYSITCDSISKDSFNRTSASKSISVDALPDKVMTLLDSDSTAKMQEIMSEWCSTKYPTANKAVWDGTATISSKDGIIQVTLPFKLDNMANSRLSLIYDCGTKTFSINK